MTDPHKIALARHQNKIDAQADIHEAEQKERQEEADKIDWKQAGEDAIRNMSESDKADQLRELEDHVLARCFDSLVMNLTDWIPYRFIEQCNVDIDATCTLQTIRDEQSALAEAHFLKTGEWK